MISNISASNNNASLRFGSVHEKTAQGVSRRISEDGFVRKLKNIMDSDVVQFGTIPSRNSIPATDHTKTGVFLITESKNGKPEAIKVIPDGNPQSTYLVTNDSPKSEGIIKNIKKLIEQATPAIS